MPYLTALQVVRLTAGLGVAAVLLRYFGPSLRGVLAIVLAVQGALALLFPPTSQAVQAFVPRLEPAGPRLVVRLLWRAYAIRAVATACVSVMLLVVAVPAASFYQLSELAPLVRILATTNLVAAVAGPMDIHALIALRRHAAVFSMGVLDALGGVAAMVAVVWWRLDLGAYLWAAAIGPLLAAGYGWAHFHQWSRARPEAGTTTDVAAVPSVVQLLRFAGPVAGTTMLYQLADRLGMLIAGRVFDAGVVGLYAFASTTVARIWSMVSIPETALLPRFSEEMAERGREALARLVERAIGAMLAYSAVVTILVIVFAREVTGLLAGPAFADAVPLFQVCIAQLVFRAPEVARLVFYVHEEPGGILSRYALKTFVEFVGYAVLIPRWGVLGIAWAQVFAIVVWGVVISLGGLRRLVNDTAVLIRRLAGVWSGVGWVAILMSVSWALSIRLDAAGGLGPFTAKVLAGVVLSGMASVVVARGQLGWVRRALTMH